MFLISQVPAASDSENTELHDKVLCEDHASNSVVENQQVSQPIDTKVILIVYDIDSILILSVYLWGLHSCGNDC